MKTAIVLNGCSTSLEQQIEEVNNFSHVYLSEDYELEIWILGNDEPNTADFRFIKKISYVGWIQTKTDYLAEDFLDALQELFIFRKPELIVFGSSSYGTELSVRLAYRLEGSSCIGVRSCQKNNEKYYVEKAVYSNNLSARFLLKKKPYCISIAKGFKGSVPTLACLPEIEVTMADMDKEYAWIRSYHRQHKEKAEGLEAASVVVAVGRGIGSRENVKKIEALAKILDAKLGASKPVVMSAWTEMDKLIGASGAIISPEVCIAIGISGAAAFSAGIEKSKWIAAVNKDERAAIFKISDVGIVGDFTEIVDQLIKLLNQE